MLKKTDEYFLQILKAALRGETVELSLAEDEWKKVLQLANMQKLLPIVFESVRKCPDSSKYPQVFAVYREAAIRQVMRQTAQSVDFKALYQKMRDKGLHPVVVKGQLCNALYPLGDYRISADDDLYIAEEEFFACHQTLKECGLVTETPEEDFGREHEISYRNASNTLYIELHRSLFGLEGNLEELLNGYFKETFDSLEERDGFLSMPPHEHLLYLILHAYKHFIHCGVGIRQTCDIGLWAKAYASEIDWELLRTQCARVNAQVYAAAMFKIAGERLGIEMPLPECWDYADIEEEAMLADMFEGGLYGASTMSRLHSSNLTIDAVRSAEWGGAKRGVFSALFPERRYMERGYPFVKKYPFLLPAAWVFRISRYRKETRRMRNNSAAQSLQVAKERIVLLKQFGIIKTNNRRIR